MHVPCLPRYSQQFQASTFFATLHRLSLRSCKALARSCVSSSWMYMEILAQIFSNFVRCAKSDTCKYSGTNSCIKCVQSSLRRRYLSWVFLSDMCFGQPSEGLRGRRLTGHMYMIPTTIRGLDL